MEGINKMSDAELRAALTRCGYKSIPITTTTRNILIKKIELENHEGRSKGKMDHNISGLKHGQCADKFNGDRYEDKIEKKPSRRGHSATPRDQASTSGVIYKTRISDTAQVVSTERASSDNELRNALTKHGYEKIPITNTTRSTLMTKMKSLTINNKVNGKLNNKPETSAIACHDADGNEESNEDAIEGTDTTPYSNDWKTFDHDCTCKHEEMEDDSEMSSDCTEDDDTDDENMTSDIETADDSDDYTSDSE